MLSIHPGDVCHNVRNIACMDARHNKIISGYRTGFEWQTRTRLLKPILVKIYYKYTENSIIPLNYSIIQISHTLWMYIMINQTGSYDMYLYKKPLNCSLANKSYSDDMPHYEHFIWGCIAGVVFSFLFCLLVFLSLFPYGVLGWIRYFIVAIPDLCRTLLFLDFSLTVKAAT